MNIKKILIPLLLILFMASMAVFGAPVYVNVGPTTEFDGDIKILSEIVAEGTTVDGWETTIFFTDPTADRTITIPDYDVTVGSAIFLTVTDNEATNENNAILFTSGGVESGVLNIESDGGDFYYNPSDGSLHAILLYGDGSNITNIGAATATALTIDAKVNEAGGITKGQPVYFSGAVGQLPQASLADNTVDGKNCVAGIAAETKADGQTILIRVGGQLDNTNTSAFSDGDCLYLSTAGTYSNTIPTSGAIIIVAGVEYDHATLGKLLLLIRRTKDKGAPSGTDLIVRMGDNIAANKVLFKDYANNEVAYIDSDGKADFTSLTLDTALLPAEGGTGVANAANNTITFAGNFTLGITLTANTSVTLPTSGIVVSDATACTDIEGTGLSIAGGVLNWAAPVNSIDSDAYVDASIDHEHLHNDVIHGMTIATLAAADEFLFWDDTPGALRKITWTNLMGTIGLADLASSTSANLASTLSDETGTLKVVYSDSPTFTTKITVPVIDITGGQVAFPAAQSASADANTLDDYEEGSWTPGITFGGASVDITYGIQAGYYTKIGNMVMITGNITLTSKGSSNGSALITGLPFTVVNNDAGYSPPSLRFRYISFANQYQGYATKNTTTIALRETTEAGAGSPLTDANFANNSIIYVSCTYRAE